MNDVSSWRAPVDDLGERVTELEGRQGKLEDRLDRIESTTSWLRQKSKWAALGFLVLELVLRASHGGVSP